MDARELRIGNYVSSLRSASATVVEITPNKLHYFMGFRSSLDIDAPVFKMHIKDFSPIPLTEEWLVSAGFHRGEYHEEPVLRRHVLGFGDNSIDFDEDLNCQLTYDSMLAGVTLDCQYVHAEEGFQHL